MNNTLIILGVLLACFLVWAFTQRRYPIIKYVIYAIVCIVLPISAVYCVNQLNIYYNTEGGVVGVLTGIYETNKVEVVDNLTFEVTGVEFKQVEGEHYSLRMSVDKVMKLDEDKHYCLFVNNVPCETSEEDYSTTYILSKYEYNFYNSEKNVLENDQLSISIAFYENYTDLLIETHGGESAIKYWNSYFNKNNFVIKINETNYLKDNNLNYGGNETEGWHTATYYVYEELYLTQVYATGATINTPTATKEDHIFKGWSIDKVNVVDSSNYAIEQDLVFYAVFEELSAGLYSYYDNQTMYYSWQELKDNGYISVYSGKLTKIQTPSSMPSKLIVSDEVTDVELSTSYIDYGVHELVLPDTIENLDSWSNFELLRNMRYIQLPNTIKELDSNLFNYCYNLMSITIPESVETVDNYSFRDCFRLVEIINKSSLNLDNVALYNEDAVIHTGSSRLRTIDDLVYYVYGEQFILVGTNEVVNVLNIDPSCNKISSYAFYQNETLIEAHINGNIKSIGKQAFWGCDNLAKVNMSDLNYNMSSIGERAFTSCISLKNIFIPKGIEGLQDDVFRGISDSFVIYCAEESRPSSWSSSWDNGGDYTYEIKWGYTFNEYIQAIS